MRHFTFEKINADRYGHIMSAAENFRRNLKRIREERGLDAANLSRDAGLNKRAVTDIETGASKNPTLRSAVAISEQLKVPLAELIGDHARTEIVAEWQEFLSQYDEAEQRTLLQAVASLRGQIDG